MPATYSPENLLGDLAAAFPGREISDVQVRTNGLIYLHTNRGLEIAESFGPQSNEAVHRFAEALFMKQSVELWADADSGSTPENGAEKARH
jgi:twitching motility protein PilT